MHGGLTQGWKLKLLGAFELTSPQGAPVRLAERKARALLAYVALSPGQTVSREALLGLLWESRPVAQARQSLRQVLHRLRTATGEPALLLADKDSVAIDSRRMDLDVWIFMQAARGDAVGDLQHASSLYGSPLANLDVDEPEFDAWLRSMRLQLSQTASALCKRLALAHQAGGDYRAAIDACKQWVAADPCDEEGYRLMMQLYAAAGDRGGLKSAFSALEAMCDAHLDSSPTDETRRLFRELLSDTPFPPLIPRPPIQAQVADAVSAPTSAPPTVAVLRWQCARDDPDQAYLADATCEELMLTLGSMRSMRVLARGTSFGVPTEMGEAVTQARALGADYLIGGSLWRREERVKVGAWLADTRIGEVVWTRRYHESVRDLFALHEDLAYRIAASIEPSVNRIELRAVQRKSPRDMTAYDMLQRGYWHFYRGQFDEAIRCFMDAIERDSGFAHAYAMLALVIYFSGQVRRTDAWARELERAYGLALKASVLDPDDAKAHLVLGQTSAWLGRHAEADEALSRAATLNPSLGLASSARSYLSLMQGEFECAIRNLNVAVRYRQSDPGLGLCLPSQALASYLMGNYVDALETARKALVLRPTFWIGQQVLVATLGRTGRARDAADVLDDMRRRAYESDPYTFAARVPYTDAKWTQNVSDGLAEAGWR
jgi:DNA-binding SARP family transcriptional activator/TolB-like protein/Tfp pilus assembly protein PilF